MDLSQSYDLIHGDERNEQTRIYIFHIYQCVNNTVRPSQMQRKAFASYNVYI